MLHCPRCGSSLPEGEEVQFCPNCGTSLNPQLGYKGREISSAEAPRKRKTGLLQRRRLVVVLVFIVCIVVTSFGTAARISPSSAEGIEGEIEQQRNAIQTLGLTVIFGNNFMHSLIMFVPGLGPAWGFYVLYNTGVAIAAIGALLSPPANPLVLFASLFITPFAWMEYIAYSLSIAESIWLVFAVIRHRLRDELSRASKYVAMSAIILLLAALVETVFLVLLG